jgi:polysaccharide export outer membrane protein
VAPLAKAESDQSGLRLGPGDLIEVNVYGIPELSQKVRVGSGGAIYLPLIDAVPVEGLTPEQTQTEIEKRLSDGGFVRSPHVSVLVSESATATISVLGEVARPGIYPVASERRLFDLISAAGGLTERAGRTVLLTHRRPEAKTESLDLPQDFSQASDANVTVRAGDTIAVSRAGVFYVVGDVTRPSGFVADRANLSVLKALALAGGPGRTASMGHAVLIRKNGDRVEQIKVPLGRILKAQADDVAMQPEDILYVPTSGGKLFARRTAEVAFQAAGAASIVAVRP